MGLGAPSFKACGLQFLCAKGTPRKDKIRVLGLGGQNYEALGLRGVTGRVYGVQDLGGIKGFRICGFWGSEKRPPLHGFESLFPSKSGWMS